MEPLSVLSLESRAATGLQQRSNSTRAACSPLVMPDCCITRSFFARGSP